MGKGSVIKQGFQTIYSRATDLEQNILIINNVYFVGYEVISARWGIVIT